MNALLACGFDEVTTQTCNLSVTAVSEVFGREVAAFFGVIDDFIGVRRFWTPIHNHFWNIFVRIQHILQLLGQV
ncbi:Uncharacterised protein [Vibrio cholerae]|uniref:Uncharacterized protein n=1 Tax=Vibrio cholerae TaxID=666 RepID=A0A655R615_VIBCL|nr:Uncharacterised protein [Vibrio cholerae]CSA89092.1 Uncharacterised protein [Vibrio cholerae]